MDVDGNIVQAIKDDMLAAPQHTLIPKPTTVSRSVRRTMGSPAKMMVYCRAHGSSLYPEMMLLGLLESVQTLVKQSSAVMVVYWGGRNH